MIITTDTQPPAIIALTSALAPAIIALTGVTVALVAALIVVAVAFAVAFRCLCCLCKTFTVACAVFCAALAVCWVLVFLRYTRRVCLQEKPKIRPYLSNPKLLSNHLVGHIRKARLSYPHLPDRLQNLRRL